MTMNQRSEKGFTLLELLLVLAIGALVIAGAVLIYNTVAVSRGATAAVQLVSAIRSETQATYGSTGVYAGIDEQQFITAGLLPQTGVDPFGGVVVVDVDANPRQYTIQLPAVPAQACVKLATAITDTGIVDININGTGQANPGTTAQWPSTATTNCGAADPASITWTLTY